MVRKMRIKFTVLSVLSVAAVLAVILGIINAANYRRVAAEADQVLEMMAENKGRFPKMKPFIEKDRKIEGRGKEKKHKRWGF